MNRIESSHTASADADAPSVTNQVRSPSSTTAAACSTCPFGLSTSVSVEVPGGRSASCCEVIEVSQASRSGPATVTTPRCDRSTTAAPASRARCSATGSP
jgi:hypothetical protein